MSKRKMPLSRHRKNRPSRQPLSVAALMVIERLEGRQLLSAVISTYPVPGADADSWDGSTAHIVAAPDGNFWFTDPTNNAIGKVTPAGVVTEFPLPVHNAPLDDGTGGSGPDDPEPSDIVAGPGGNLWFTETGVHRIGEITPAGVITEYKTPTADSEPAGITVGSDGNVWFAESNNEAIGRLSPDGKIKEFSLDNLDVSYSDGIVAGSDGNVWFIADDNDGDGRLARITPSGDVTPFAIDDDPTSLLAGADGNLRVGGSDGHLLTVNTQGITLANDANQDGSEIDSLVNGLDGNIWFTTAGDNQIGELTANHVISEFTLPATDGADDVGPQPNDLVQASDGTIWYVDSYNPLIGKIDLTNALLASASSVNVTAGTNATDVFASFTDFSGASDAADYTAIITLSDGSTLPGSIAAGADGGFDVSAANDWTIGYNSVTVTITDTRDASRLATATTWVDVTAPKATGAGVDITATSGQIATETVATFTGVAVNSLSQYSASIDWGDGHDTAGSITLNADGGFDVAGSNRYAAGGTYAVTVTLEPYQSSGIIPGGPGGIVPVTRPVATAGTLTPSVSTSAASSNVSVVGGPIIVDPTNPYYADDSIAKSTATVASGAMDGTGYSVQARSTAPFAGNVAAFTLADPNADLSHLHASVQWNDPGIRDWYFTLSNADSAAVITAGAGGGFVVSTTANFANSGLYHFVVNISDDRLGGGDSAIVGVAYGQIVVDTPFRWLPIFQAGRTSTVPGGSTPAAVSTATTGVVTDPALGEHVKPISIATHAAVSKTFSHKVGVLKGISTGAGGLTDLNGTIDWGDGTTSPASFVAGPGKQIFVRGSHAYATAGNYPVSVEATQVLYVNGIASPLYPLTLPTIESAARIASAGLHARPITTGGIPVNTTVGANVNGTVATFTAPAAATGVTRSATIFWGDGHHSTGVITTGNSNQLSVAGSHDYRKAGKYKVHVSVTQKGSTGVKVQKLLALIKTTASVSKG